GACPVEVLGKLPLDSSLPGQVRLHLLQLDTIVVTLRPQLRQLSAGLGVRVEAFLRLSPLFDECVDALLRMAEVVASLLPGLVRGGGVPPLSQSRLQSRDGVVAVLGLRVRLVEPECRVERGSVASVAEPCGDQAPRGLVPVAWLVLVAGLGACRCGDAGEVVGNGDPPAIDRRTSGHLVGDVLDGGIVRRGHHHLETGELRSELTHAAPMTVVRSPAVSRVCACMLGSRTLSQPPCSLAYVP